MNTTTQITYKDYTDPKCAQWQAGDYTSLSFHKKLSAKLAREKLHREPATEKTSEELKESLEKYLSQGKEVKELASSELSCFIDDADLNYVGGVLETISHIDSIEDYI